MHHKQNVLLSVGLWSTAFVTFSVSWELCNVVLLVVKAPVTLSRFKPRFTRTHPDLRQMVKSGCIGMRRDGKKEIPASIRCLTMLLRCLHDSSTDPLRLKTAALRFTTVELRMLTNTHDASTIRYGASTIQAGSATVVSRPPTNVHDLVVGMLQLAKL